MLSPLFVQHSNLFSSYLSSIHSTRTQYLQSNHGACQQQCFVFTVIDTVELPQACRVARQQ